MDDLIIYSDKVPIETHGVKYLGSKLKIVSHIGEMIKDLNIETAIDVFSGTTRVAQYLRQKNIKTMTSDLSWATTCYANTYVHNDDNSHLQLFVDTMNNITPNHGWLSENYTGGDVPQDATSGDGRCFQLKNTLKADAARDYIETLDLMPWEKSTLITSVINALDAVDNTVGVQQAYLKTWCSRSYKDIVFKLPANIKGPKSYHIEGDCLKNEYPSTDLAYLDPPYSPHSYSTYYHIWDSIARWDKPATSLKAKRRIDRVAKDPAYDASMESPWNRSSNALEAFNTLLGKLPVKYALISYSDESLVKQDDLMNVCREHGETKIKEITYARNIMSQIGNAVNDAEKIVEKNQKNKELLILVNKG